MTKPFPLLCKDCKWSRPEPQSDWNLRCTHPVVNSRDAWALASGRGPGGTSARDERAKRGIFVKCGMKGKLWETK